MIYYAQLVTGYNNCIVVGSVPRCMHVDTYSIIGLAPYYNDNNKNLVIFFCILKGVQLSINATDDDTNLGNDDDLVDTLLINHSLPVGEESVRMNYIGIYGFLTMDLTIRAVCVENFTGGDCSQCVPGLTGASCDVQIIDSEDFSTPSTSTNPPHQLANQEDTSQGEDNKKYWQSLSKDVAMHMHAHSFPITAN
jgi:hypothetical protein